MVNLELAIKQQIDFLAQHKAKIFEHLNSLRSSCGFPIYSSMDLRDAGWKMSVVDYNLFPGGFNNVAKKDHHKAAALFRQFFSAKLLSAPPWKICLLPEAHTNNKGYLESVASLIKILEKAGAEIKIMWPGEPIPKAWNLKSPSGQELSYLPAEEAVKDCSAILINHDLSGGPPKALKNLKNPPPVYPSPNLGWFKRKKSKHFEIVWSLLNNLKKEFPDFEPWFFAPYSVSLDNIDLKEATAPKELQAACEKIIAKIEKKYVRHNIKKQAKVFIKNDQGTYGLGVYPVNHPKQIAENFSDFVKKMKRGKDSQKIDSFIIQEAVPSALKTSSKSDSILTAESVFYKSNGKIFASFLRIAQNSDEEGKAINLNQPGSFFTQHDRLLTPSGSPIVFPPLRNSDILKEAEAYGPYQFLALIHALAAGMEECLGEPNQQE